MRNLLIWVVFTSIFALGVFVQCQRTASTIDYSKPDSSTPAIGDWVVIGQFFEPSTLNPTNFLDESGENISHHVYQRLVDRNPFPPFALEPQLAATLPTVSPDGLRYTFDIHPKAQWDNGQPITANDVLFSLKLYRFPLINCPNKRPYFEAVAGVEIDSSSNIRFTVVMKERYFLSESALGTDLVIVPAYIFDPKGILTKYSLNDLIAPAALKDQALISFAERYNSPAFAKDVANLVGSGAYQVAEWRTNQKIVLKRKKKWWADSLMKSQAALRAYPQQLVYRQFKDKNTAVAALKAGEIDVITGFDAQQFKELSADLSFNQHFKLDTVDAFAYSYLGMNNKPSADRTPFFVDKQVRKAMAQLMNVDQITSSLLQGMGKRCVGPVLPIHGNIFNDTLKPIPFKPELAQKLLAASGWIDSDKDGILDKSINGKSTPFRFELLIPAGNELRKQIALVYQDALRKAGIDMKITALDFGAFVARNQSQQFDMYYGGWGLTAAEPDLKQFLHTRYWVEKGSNDVGFGDATSDALIDAIRQELDPEKRKALYWKLQALVYDEQPYVFLVSASTPIAIHRRYQDAKPCPMRPNFQANDFWVPTNWVKYK
jgi:peptide/nickel transport system substrate-binding protein